MTATPHTSLPTSHRPHHTTPHYASLHQSLGVSSAIADNMADMEIEALGVNLSLTDATLCGIARCLLSSVDLLLISNLVDVLSEQYADNVMKVRYGYGVRWACYGHHPTTSPTH